MGQAKYFSCIAQVDGVIGNSSSGLTEVPSFNKGTINIGDRQKGRLKADSVINCEASESSIAAALKILYSEKFVVGLPNVVNPYGEGGAISKVVKHLRETSIESIVKKTFHDL
jgi:GDP/UDP-N,N'-diacetylbacillosamine 2-epimerase (hydrolysing)